MSFPQSKSEIMHDENAQSLLEAAIRKNILTDLDVYRMLSKSKRRMKQSYFAPEALHSYYRSCGHPLPNLAKMLVDRIPKLHEKPRNNLTIGLLGIIEEKIAATKLT